MLLWLQRRDRSYLPTAATATKFMWMLIFPSNIFRERNTEQAWETFTNPFVRQNPIVQALFGE